MEANQVNTLHHRQYRQSHGIAVNIDISTPANPSTVRPFKLNQSRWLKPPATGMGKFRKPIEFVAFTPGELNLGDNRVLMPRLKMSIEMNHNSGPLYSAKGDRIYWDMPHLWSDPTRYGKDREAVWIGWRYRILSVEYDYHSCGHRDHEEKLTSQEEGIVRVRGAMRDRRVGSAARQKSRQLQLFNLTFSCLSASSASPDMDAPTYARIWNNSWFTERRYECVLPGVETTGTIKGDESNRLVNEHQTFWPSDNHLPMTVEMEFELLTILGRDCLVSY